MQQALAKQAFDASRHIGHVMDGGERVSQISAPDLDGGHPYDFRLHRPTSGLHGDEAYRRERQQAEFKGDARREDSLGSPGVEDELGGTFVIQPDLDNQQGA